VTALGRINELLGEPKEGDIDRTGMDDNEVELKWSKGFLNIWTRISVAEI